MPSRVIGWDKAVREELQRNEICSGAGTGDSGRFKLRFAETSLPSRGEVSLVRGRRHRELQLLLF
jgi:hypothetical protein